MFPKRPTDKAIIIIDYGSQYTFLIARRLRELGCYCEIIASDAPNAPADLTLCGVILSGGPDSVGAQHSRTLPSWVLDHGVPILGICYGMQLLAKALGAEVRSGLKREYGEEKLFLTDLGVSDPLFAGVPTGSSVWMSHGDDVIKISEGATVLGESAANVVAAMKFQNKPIYGMQFHPEVYHSEWGKKILENFLVNICHVELNWQGESLITSLCSWINAQVNETDKVLVAASGGVDSTVAVALLNKALGSDRVFAVLVDTGLLRKGEAEWVASALEDAGIHHFSVLPRQKDFLTKLQGISDPEEKRKIIGRTFIEVFEAFTEGCGYTHLAQGTLYPDVIESAGHGSGSKVIKSHHNVGGLPDVLKLKLIEPFRYLFKDEVRAIGVELGLPESLVMRHPFPGPGLGIRIIGEISEEKLVILREADAIFINMLRENNLYASTWQAFAVLLPIKTVGVMGDNRTYEYTLALRSVDASDGMTAKPSQLPYDFLLQVGDRIVREVKGINRVVYDITSKPPATIEWE